MSEIDIQQAADRRSTDQILDVREDFEVAEGMIPGALHIPLGQLTARLGRSTATAPSSSSAGAATAAPASPMRLSPPATPRTPWAAA